MGLYSAKNKDHLYIVGPQGLLLAAVIEGRLCKLILCPEVVTCAEGHCHITSFPESRRACVCVCVCVVEEL